MSEDSDIKNNDLQNADEWENVSSDSDSKDSEGTKSSHNDQKLDPAAMGIGKQRAEPVANAGNWKNLTLKDDSNEVARFNSNSNGQNLAGASVKDDDDWFSPVDSSEWAKYCSASGDSFAASSISKGQSPEGASAKGGDDWDAPVESPEWVNEDSTSGDSFAASSISNGQSPEGATEKDDDDWYSPVDSPEWANDSSASGDSPSSNSISKGHDLAGASATGGNDWESSVDLLKRGGDESDSSSNVSGDVPASPESSERPGEPKNMTADIDREESKAAAGEPSEAAVASDGADASNHQAAPVAEPSRSCAEPSKQPLQTPAASGPPQQPPQIPAAGGPPKQPSQTILASEQPKSTEALAGSSKAAGASCEAGAAIPQAAPVAEPSRFYADPPNQPPQLPAASERPRQSPQIPPAGEPPKQSPQTIAPSEQSKPTEALSDSSRAAGASDKPGALAAAISQSPKSAGEAVSSSSVAQPESGSGEGAAPPQAPAMEPNPVFGNMGVALTPDLSKGSAGASSHGSPVRQGPSSAEPIHGPGPMRQSTGPEITITLEFQADQVPPGINLRDFKVLIGSELQVIVDDINFPTNFSVNKSLNYQFRITNRFRFINCKGNDFFSNLNLSCDFKSGKIALFSEKPVAFEGKLNIAFKISNLSNGQQNQPFRFQKDLYIAPDPRSLWKDLEVEDFEGYHYRNEDSFFKSILGTNKVVIAASCRGRSHAHVGKPRDDNFFCQIGAPDGWNIFAVADGAGSARFSRKGSDLACRTVVGELASLLTSEKLASRFSDASMRLNWEKRRGDQDFAPKDSYREELHIDDIVYTVVYKAFININYESINKSKELGDSKIGIKDYNTTLLFIAIKKLSLGYFYLSFWIGDGGMAICRPDNQPGKALILGAPDSGEYSGQTRFLTMKDEINPEKVGERTRCGFLEDFDSIILATDGITDPFFPSDSSVMDQSCWLKFLDSTLKNGDVENPGVPELFDSNLSEEVRRLALAKWLNFWSKGNHDDRTILIVR